MNDEQKKKLFESFSDPAGKNKMVFEVRRVNIEDGKSFSKDACDGLMDQIFLFVGARILARWKGTKEPPSIVKVEVKVNAG